jgi:small subunit ribosomal protein S17
MATTPKQPKKKADAKEAVSAVATSSRQTLTGVVVSRKLDKTAGVLVTRFVEHPKYKKHIKRNKKYLVHDPKNETTVGDRVTIISIRPMSRAKVFQIEKIIGRSQVKPKLYPSKKREFSK